MDHALAIGLPGVAAGTFIQPASSTDGRGPATSLPEGSRIFLRPDFTLSTPVDPMTGRALVLGDEQRRYAADLVQTLQTYGAIVVGRAPVPTLYSERVDGTVGAPLAGHELSSVGLEDFRVVDFEPTDRIPYPRAGAEVDATQDVRAPTLLPTAARSAAQPGVVTVDGDDDPLTGAAARAYLAAGTGRLDRAATGGSAAFQQLCRGGVDLVDSSRPISPAEWELCRTQGLDIVQFQVAAGATVLATRSETDLGGDCLDTDAVERILAADSPVTDWSQVADGFGDVPLRVAGPETDTAALRFLGRYLLEAPDPGATTVSDGYTAFPDADEVRDFVVGSTADLLASDHFLPLVQARRERLRIALPRALGELDTARQAVRTALERRAGRGNHHERLVRRRPTTGLCRSARGADRGRAAARSLRPARGTAAPTRGRPGPGRGDPRPAGGLRPGLCIGPRHPAPPLRGRGDRR